MTNAPLVTLDATSLADATVMANLLELYAHELSGVFPDVAIGSDGRFGYPELPLYWSEPERRFPFVIRCDGGLAGFALARIVPRSGSETEHFDVAEFFVLHRYRRAGVGRSAARLLWNRLPGKWRVRVAEENESGLAFWQRVIADVAGNHVSVSTRPGKHVTWKVFAFDVAGDTSTT